MLAFFEHLLESISSGMEDREELNGQKRAAAAGSGEKPDGTLSPEPAVQPDLKFLQLVFAGELGKGAFSTVKKAMVVNPSVGRSQWPSFAVKQVSTELMKRMGYEASVRREVTVLRAVQHPCVARLVASFRYRQGAFLVAELATRGDLHSHVVRHGAVSPACARHIAGELVAAMAAVHELGFAFGDLKPENVLLTGAGHAKLTDFGAVRPCEPKG